MNEDSANFSQNVKDGPEDPLFGIEFEFDTRKYLENILDDIEFVETDTEDLFIYSSEYGEEETISENDEDELKKNDNFNASATLNYKLVTDLIHIVQNNDQNDY